jgi:hypothetical protein
MDNLDDLRIQELKSTIDVISLLQLRENTLKEELDYFNSQNEDKFGTLLGALMRLDHETMFLCIDTFSLHQGISEQKSLYSKIIKQNGRFFSKIDKAASADKKTIVHLVFFTTEGKREATSEEIDECIKDINESSLEGRKELKESTGIPSYNHTEMDEWWNNILDKKAIEKLNFDRKIFAHRLDKLENLKKALTCNTPQSINESLNAISIVLNDYKKILQDIIGYKTSIYYEGYQGLVYDSISRIKQYEELFSSNG